MWFESSSEILRESSPADWILQHYEVPSLPPVSPAPDTFSKSIALVKWLLLMEGHYDLHVSPDSADASIFPIEVLRPSNMAFDDSPVFPECRYERELHSLYNRAYVEYVAWHMLRWVSTLTHFPHQLVCYSATFGTQVNHLQILQSVDWYRYGDMIQAYPNCFYVSPDSRQVLEKEFRAEWPNWSDDNKWTEPMEWLDCEFDNETIDPLPRIVGMKREWAEIDPPAADSSELPFDSPNPFELLLPVASPTSSEVPFPVESPTSSEVPFYLSGLATSPNRRASAASEGCGVYPTLSSVEESRPEDSTHNSNVFEQNYDDASTGPWIQWNISRLQRTAALPDQYLHIANMPVLRLHLQRADITLADWVLLPRLRAEDDGALQSILFQLAFVLAAYQEAIQFVHGDLHAGNVMLVRSEETYGWYECEDEWFRVPLHGWRVALVDFGRSCFRWKDRWVAGDDYSMVREGEAAGQWNMDPYYDPRAPLVGYNRSFDLARLFNELMTQMNEAMTQHFPASLALIERWMVDDFGGTFHRTETNEIRYPGFRLYRYLARHVHGLVPSRFLRCEKNFLGWHCPRPEGSVAVASVSEIKRACLSRTDMPPTSTPAAPFAERRCNIATPRGSMRRSTDRSTSCY